jgi:hypothetical protein
MAIGGTTAAAGSFTNLSVTGTTSFDGSEGTAGQVLTSAGTGNTPTWATASSLPSQTGNSGKYLTTDGSSASWAAVTASTATNLAGGALGSVPYQLLSGTTTFLAGNTTTTPQFLTSTGAAGLVTAPSYTSSTGSGNVVLATSPTLVTPALGTPSSGTLTNCTFPTLNQNTTGSSATVTGNATGSTFGFNSGYGSVATAYGCRAWVNFNGTTNTGGFCTIRASGNVSSVTDNGTGDYTINFTNALPDANYAVAGVVNEVASNNGASVVISNTTAPTSSAVRVLRIQGNTTTPNADCSIFCVSIHR